MESKSRDRAVSEHTSVESGIELSDYGGETSQDISNRNKVDNKMAEKERKSKEHIVCIILCLLLILVALAIAAWTVYVAHSNKEDIKSLTNKIEKLTIQLEHIEVVVGYNSQRYAVTSGRPVASVPESDKESEAVLQQGSNDGGHTRADDSYESTTEPHSGGVLTVIERMDNAERNLNLLESTVENNKNKIEAMEQVLDEDHSSIGFSAYKKRGEMYNASGVAIIFDMIISNKGDHYNRTSSRFTCPSYGLYAFFVSIHSDDGMEVHASIVHEGVIMAYLLADDEAGGGHDSHTSASVVIHCDVNEQVWVQVNCPGYLCEVEGRRYSTFSGFRIN